MIKNFLNENENKSSFVIGFVMILLACILGFVNMFTTSSTPVAVDTNFELYAKTFYEEGFYNEFLSTTLEGNINNFEQYENGFKFSARKIFESINVDPSEYFVSDGVECSLDNSKVVIYPKSPYGKKDYKIDVELAC